MKRKVFSVLTVSIFMVTFMNVNAIDQQLSKCEILAINVHTQMQEAGIDHATAYALSEAVLQACEKAQN